MKKHISILILPFIFSEFAYGATCPTGMTANIVFSGTFVGRDNGGCPTGYVRYEAPDAIQVLFTGFVMPTVPQTCPLGQYMNNGTCTPYERDDCPSDYGMKHAANGLTFSGRDNGGCPTGYVRYDAPDNFFVRFTGFLGTAVSVCPWGQYMNSGTCTPYERGTCPSGYHAMGPDASFDLQSKTGTCTSGYTSWDSVASCTDDSTDSICTTYCGNGYTHLNTSTGLKYNIYSMRQTTPSLNIGTPENRCYINMTSGRASGAINMDYNGSVYHLTD
ncbi:MAG: hypothetical protein KBS86_01005 [Proteobacteria bacterium]|nr:hypothetical protein [Candidatus Enterousia scatequi]